MNWDDAVAIEPVGDQRFHARVDEQWTSLQGVHGGIVAALAMTATERVLRDAGVDPAATLRSATLGYVAGNVVGDLTVDVKVIRRGRSLITSHARTVQDGRTTTVARFHHSTPWDGPDFSDLTPPPARPAGAVPLRREDVPPCRPDHDRR